MEGKIDCVGFHWVYYRGVSYQAVDSKRNTGRCAHTKNVSSVAIFASTPTNNSNKNNNNIYPGSSSHPKVVFREVLHPIELEFGNVDFRGERKTGELGEKPLETE